MNPALLAWYRRSHRDLPWRRTRNPYAILVSEIMLQQTQVKTVIPYFLRWLKRFPNVRALAAASERDVLKSWEGLGYYRRARLLHAAARRIVERHAGHFPESVEAIAALPGVGRYTLGAVGSIAFGLRLPVLDGNVIRVLCRWYGIDDDTRKTVTRKRLWALAEGLLPPEDGQAGDFNQAMMELGATVCLPRKPMCLICPVRKGCRAFKTGEQEVLPRAATRRATVREFEYAGLVMKRGRVLLCQRAGGQRMEALWQFPSVVMSRRTRGWVEEWNRTFGLFETREEIHSLNYSVTHHRIHLTLHRIGGFAPNPQSAPKWISVKRCRELAFTAAHRKLADRFLGR